MPSLKQPGKTTITSDRFLKIAVTHLTEKNSRTPIPDMKTQKCIIWNDNYLKCELFRKQNRAILSPFRRFLILI